MKVIKSAKLLVLDDANDVLVLRRSKTHPWAALKPDLPGGIIEEHESFEIGILRELVEETGIIVSPDDLHLLYSAEAYETHDVSVERLIYGVRLSGVKPKVVISWEHDQYEWIPITSVHSLEPENQTALDAIIAQKLWETI